MTLRQHVHSQAFDHAALLYESVPEFLETVVPFVCDGLERQQPVMIGVPEDKLTPLRDALGSAADDVAMADITELGRNPGRILATQLAFVDRHHDRRVRLVAELAWAGRSASEYLACMHHEALANIAFAGAKVSGLCPYDAASLDDSVLEHVRLTHPQIWRDGMRTRCPEYAVDAALDQCNQPLRTSPVAVTHTVEHSGGLAGARKCGERYGRLLGMSADQLADLLLVATELATNSLDHAGGACRIAFWFEAGHVVCEARDLGHWADPLAGRRPPATGHSGPYGLFVVNAIADLLRTHTTAAGTTVQAFLRLDDSAEVAS